MGLPGGHHPPHPSLDHAGKKHLWLVNRFVPCSTTTKADKNRHRLAGLFVSLTSRAPLLLAKHSIRLLHLLFIFVEDGLGHIQTHHTAFVFIFLISGLVRKEGERKRRKRGRGRGEEEGEEKRRRRERRGGEKEEEERKKRRSKMRYLVYSHM
jgi:hypothetical protein